ncbi:capsule biosynthesis protein [Saccharospirillum sp.]|uniref:capsule biosynthesis protein n=1 Tax=Saccharospirillum sp. TaxID=2033801 RepID=UPI0034A07FAA
MPSDVRHYLLLQGPHGPFYTQLTHALQQRGHSVVRVIFNSGDWASSSAMDSIGYRGGEAGFGRWVEALIRRKGFTDLLVYGDCRSYHQQALIAARHLKCRTWVMEEGYIRPFWVTVEPFGVNGNSLLPQRFKQWLATYPTDSINLKAPESPRPVGRGMRGLVFWCHVYYMMRTIGHVTYPRYRSHRPVPYLIEAAAWLKKLAKLVSGRTKRADAVADALLTSKKPFFLVPMQLDADAQVRHHSPFNSMCEFLDGVMASFADNAPGDATLVIKSHPLDSEVRNYECYAKRMSARLGLSERMIFLHGGAIPDLVKRAKGVITVNSTVGLQSVHHGCPTKVMGRSIYSHSGMTDPARLDDFWTAPTAPDLGMYRLFRYFVLTDCQLNGNFYSIRGRAMLVETVAKRLEAEQDIERAGESVPPVTPIYSALKAGAKSGKAARTRTSGNRTATSGR